VAWVAAGARIRVGDLGQRPGPAGSWATNGRPRRSSWWPRGLRSAM